MYLPPRTIEAFSLPRKSPRHRFHCDGPADIEQPSPSCLFIATEFCQRSIQQAAERSLPKPVAQGLIGAMIEIEENIHLHSEQANDGVVDFTALMKNSNSSLAIAASGCWQACAARPDYRHLTDTGNALRLALQDGQSRLSHLEPNHGYGGSAISFTTLATLNGSLRFRSDDQAITLDGVGPNWSAQSSARNP